MNATESQLAALKWLRNRNGDGCFDKTRVLVAAGERAPVMRSTWNKLRSLGLVEEYMGRKRIRVTATGLSTDVSKVKESHQSRFELDDA